MVKRRYANYLGDDEETSGQFAVRFLCHAPVDVETTKCHVLSVATPDAIVASASAR